MGSGYGGKDLNMQMVTADKGNNCRTTVVIPNWNGKQYIEACLDSVFLSTKVPTVIVVDNGSTDGSDQIVAKKYPQVQLVCLSENTGFCHAVNVGIEKTQSEFVFLLNNDTVIDQKCIEQLEKVMDSSENLFSAGAKMINMKFPEKLDDAGDFFCALGWAFARGKDKPVERYQKNDRIFAACAGAAMYRRSLFPEVGLFDENHFAYLEDVDIGYRANIMGYWNAFAPNALVFHAGSGSSGSRHNTFKVDLTSRNSVYLLYKNMPVLQLILNMPLLLIGYLIKFSFFALKGMGGTYLRGLSKGVALAFSQKGREKKVIFHLKNVSNYFRIQWDLWIGILRRVF